jgi:cystathionine gamma-lyase
VNSSVAVLKLGGSVLAGIDGYRSAAAFVRSAVAGGSRVVAVVSAELGHTDALLGEAQQLHATPNVDVLALLWSTGELRSVALLTFALNAVGIPAAGLNVHEAGLRRARTGSRDQAVDVNPLNLRAALDQHRVVVVPGFLATSGQRVVTLERGGSDWSAVLLAAALGAPSCVLVKDVDGYYTGDPREDAGATLIPALSYEDALAMADAGCPLVQRQAIAEARARGVELVVRSFASRGTRVSEMTSEVIFQEAKNDLGDLFCEERHMDFATKTIHAGQPVEPQTGAVVSPIFQTTTYQQIGPGEHRGFDYTRTGNPTRKRLESVLAELEGVNHAAVFGSGLAAEHAILQAYLKPGCEIVVPSDVYGGTFRMLHRVFEPIGCRVTTVDFSDLAAVSRVVTDDTTLVWLESPTNPRLLVYDARGALVVVDNTFATPYFQQPFQLGADLVVHSVTKYLAGHSDLVQGAVIGRDSAVFEPVAFLQNALGGVPSPFDCWLTLRGLKTLELRMQRHAENASAVAEALAAHPRVSRVYFPGLSSHPGHDIARRQMTGFGGMVSFELDGTPEDAAALVASFKYFALGESLGGVRALVCLPCKMTHASIPPDTRRELGLSDTLIRLSPGCESPKDLAADITEALNRIPVLAHASA